MPTFFQAETRLSYATATLSIVFDASAARCRVDRSALTRASSIARRFAIDGQAARERLRKRQRERRLIVRLVAVRCDVVVDARRRRRETEGTAAARQRRDGAGRAGGDRLRRARRPARSERPKPLESWRTRTAARAGTADRRRPRRQRLDSAAMRRLGLRDGEIGIARERHADRGVTRDADESAAPYPRSSRWAAAAAAAERWAKPARGGSTSRERADAGADDAA